mgnify:CR=1 FL=1
MSVDPATLSIVSFPDKILLTRARPVPAITDEVRRVAERMLDLMDEAEGIGLAAPQVGLSWRLFVLDVPGGEGRSTETDPPSATASPMVFVNPRILSFEGPVEPFEEGCLSLPEIRGDVLRPPIVTVEATDLEGRTFQLRAGGLLSRCVQHEYDHLDGVLILDRMTQKSRLKTRSAVRDLQS